MNTGRFFVAGAGVTALGIAAFVFLRAQPDEPVTAAPPTEIATCELADNGALQPIERSVPFGSYPETFSRVAGVGVGASLQDVCNHLASQGFTVTRDQVALVDLRDVGDPDDDLFARYTESVTFRGPLTNPFDQSAVEASITVVATSPATDRRIVYIDAQIGHDTPLPLPDWKALMEDFFGTPSGRDPSDLPYWIIGADGVVPGTPDDLCDTDLVSYRAGWWEALAEIDPWAEVNAHDGGSCALLTFANVFGSDAEPGHVGRTRLVMIDYKLLADSRLAENAIVKSFQYPPDR